LTSLFLACLAPLHAAEPATTYRGNSQRTACTDDKAGPTAPKVLWAFKAEDHFIASPLPVGDRLYLSGLGGLNVPTLFCFSTEPKTDKRVLWKKTAPVLTRASVSSPAVVGGKLIFGDGMHQDNGGYLHCLSAEKGDPVWQYPVPGDLVHLEGSPTVFDTRVYLGGGGAGVLCVDLNRLTLDGKEMDAAAMRKILDEKWAKLQAQYEEDKKKNPEFAIKPSLDMLPKPAPVRLWQTGQEKWHVDAPVALAGDRLLVASAFLDKEMVGDRALFSLDARTGKIEWRTPMKLNPWGGPSVSGKTVVVTGSTIGYDYKAIKGAKGFVAAYDLSDGKEKWHKDVPGGVVGCAALTQDLAIVTATDGKVRAFDLATGDRRWIHDSKTPYFAPPAVDGGVMYAGDLRGVIHAISLADGNVKWTLDLGSDPEVKAPGMVYGGPVVHGGRIYVATCNLDGPAARQPTTVVCIGEK
jgi:outer membrane protein assembly factor BamB